MQLRELLLALPFTSGKKVDPFWDKIPKGDIFKVIVALKELASIAKSHDSFGVIPGSSGINAYRHRSQNGCRIYTCEIGLIAYDIAAQLAPRDEELNMKDEYAFALSDVYLDQDLFHDVESYQIVKRIIENFKSRCEGKKAIFGAIIYPEKSDDPSRTYFFKNLLTEEGKQAFCMFQKKQHFPENYHEADMFRDMFLESKGLRQPYITNHLKYLLGLSQLAHTLGSDMACENGKFYCLKPDVWTVSEDLNATSILLRSRKFKNQPLLYPLEDNIWKRNSGFWENAAFHPHEDLLRTHAADAEEKRYCFEPIGTSRYDHYRDQREKDPKGTMEEWMDEDFRVISTPDLQVQKVMEWAQHNVEQLSKPVVQNRIFSLLFEYGKIEQAYRNAPGDFVALATLFQKALWDHALQRSATLEMILWVSELIHYLKAYCVEYQIPATFVDTRPVLIERLNKAKTQSERIALAECLVHSYHGQTNLNTQDYLDFLLYTCLTKMRYQREGRLHTLADHTIFKLLVKHQSGIKRAIATLDPRTMNAFANQCVKLCANVNLHRPWKRKKSAFVEDEAGEFSLDVYSNHYDRYGVFLHFYLDLPKIMKKEGPLEVRKSIEKPSTVFEDDAGEYSVDIETGQVLKCGAATNPPSPGPVCRRRRKDSGDHPHFGPSLCL